MNENAAQPDDINGPDQGFKLSVGEVADFLSMRGAEATAAIISPTGDDGSTASVMLARSIAELGRSVVLVDMTTSGCPTRLMAAQSGLPGVADLLFGDAAFGETIHHDRLSTAHVVPQGTAAPLHATGIIDRLTMVISALGGSYDTVLMEFGAAEGESVARLLKYIDAEILVSCPDTHVAIYAQTLQDLREAGFSEVMTMTKVEAGG